MRPLMPSGTGLRMIVVAAGCLLIPMITTTARAQQQMIPPPPPPAPESGWEAEPWAIEGIAGIGTPVGALGLAADVSPLPFLSVWAGFGTNGKGLQIAAALRLRIWRSYIQAFYVAVGGSRGPYEEPTPDSGTIRINDDATWLNWELGYERRAGTFTWRLFGGVGRMLNSEDVYCFGDDVAQCEEGETWGETLPFVGLAIGVSFH